MQMNLQRRFSVSENSTNVCTMWWKVVLENSTKDELVFWLSSMKYVANAFDEEML